MVAVLICLMSSHQAFGYTSVCEHCDFNFFFLFFAFYVSTGAEEMSTGTNTNTPPKERRTVSKTARFTALAELSHQYGGI